MVHQSTNASEKAARASKTVRSVSGGPAVAARGVRSGIRRGESVSNTREVEGRRKERDVNQKWKRRRLCGTKTCAL